MGLGHPPAPCPRAHCRLLHICWVWLPANPHTLNTPCNHRIKSYGENWENKGHRAAGRPQKPPPAPPGLPCPPGGHQHADAAQFWHGTSRPAGTCGREQLTAAERGSHPEICPRDCTKQLGTGHFPPHGRSNYEDTHGFFATSPERVLHKAVCYKSRARACEVPAQGLESHLTAHH